MYARFVVFINLLHICVYAIGCACIPYLFMCTMLPTRFNLRITHFSCIMNLFLELSSTHLSGLFLQKDRRGIPSCSPKKT